MGNDLINFAYVMSISLKLKKNEWFAKLLVC